ncbi:MAG: InlB B-repeat-containing protein, partial [Erysipelotrichaceae bacterium]|nr:InlB B-repeat-containing protein [Erysipelotrichaceae bacterium]
MDNIDTDQNIPEPPDPTIEGYEFTGWYTELECI